MYTELINYALRFTACSAFFYAFYMVVLKNETCFRFNRGYLLSTILLSIVLPIIKFDFTPAPDAVINPDIFILPEVIITDSVIDSASQFGFTFFLNIAYLLVAGFLTTQLVVRLFSLWKIINTNKHLRTNKYIYEIIPTQGRFPTSSFLGYLLWDDSNKLNELQRAQIIAHERVHILHLHTYDVLLLEGLSIIFWFNPVVWFWKKAIKENHEYIADAEASKGENNYATLLATQALAANGFEVAHAFKSSEALKRLDMLKRYGQRTKWMKLLAVLPLLFFIIFTMSFSVKELDSTSTNLAEHQVTVSELPPLKEHDIDINHENPNALTSSTHPKETIGLSIPKRKEQKLLAIHNTSTSSITALNDTDRTFTIVDQSAAPQGGLQEFYNYVSKELKYPKKARKAGISGRIFIQFIIDKNGNLTNVEVVKGIGAGCDEEAKRVIENAASWSPAMHNGIVVKQKIILPITFKLG